MTTQVTIRNDNGHNIVVTTYELDTTTEPRCAGIETDCSEYYLTPGEQVQLYVWNNHSIRIEEGEAK